MSSRVLCCLYLYSSSSVPPLNPLVPRHLRKAMLHSSVPCWILRFAQTGAPHLLHVCKKLCGTSSVFFGEDVRSWYDTLSRCLEPPSAHVTTGRKTCCSMSLQRVCTWIVNLTDHTSCYDQHGPHQRNNPRAKWTQYELVFSPWTLKHTAAGYVQKLTKPPNSLFPTLK